MSTGGTWPASRGRGARCLVFVAGCKRRTGRRGVGKSPNFIPWNGSSMHHPMRDFFSISGPPHCCWSLRQGGMERDVSTGKKGVAKKRPDTTARAGRGRRGRLASMQSVVPCFAEERAVRDRGLRILARMLARAHLQRHGLLAPGETDATHEVPDSSDEGAFAPDSGITGAP